MGIKPFTDRNFAPGGPPEADKNASLPDPSKKDITRSKSEVFRDEQADLREDIADRRQKAADERENIADQRQKAADEHEMAASLSTKLSASNLALLQEANERLIVATIHAQTMTETADLAKERMSYMAEHDFLTGLPNRALLTDRLVQAIAFAQRNGKKVGLMYLDLDHFKSINDSLGHIVGDKLLQSAAKRMQGCVRLTDTISRQGGDEFVVLLPEVENVQDAVLVADKVVKAMALPHLVSGHQLNITFSIGISICPDDGNDVETIVTNADIAMYQAKKMGRNNYQVFNTEMNVRAVERQFIKQALNLALAQQKFVLHYQPKVNLETGTITGAEALIRIQETDNQLIYPERFITIAEECGLILPIGRWVLHEACRQTQAWLEAGLDIGHIAVNVSPREFHSKNFLAGVIFILNDTGLNPSYLELEMTESGLMQDTKPTTATLIALKKLGVQIAIDDFGTGYSSLSYLLRFPFNTLKIDRSFVKDLSDNSSDSGEAIVSAIIAMGMSLKKRVVAEGIETKQQLTFLQSRHCFEGQGFYFKRPLTADAFAALLETNLNQPYI